MSDAISLDLKESARITGLSYDYLYKAYRSGLLPVRFAGTKVLVKRADLEAFIDSLPSERASA